MVKYEIRLQVVRVDDDGSETQVEPVYGQYTFRTPVEAPGNAEWYILPLAKSVACLGANIACAIESRSPDYLVDFLAGCKQAMSTLIRDVEREYMRRQAANN